VRLKISYKFPASIISLLLIALSVTLIAAASGPKGQEVIPLPNGFQPEGIAAGRGSIFYVGSIPTGAIFSGSIMTGQGAVLVPAHAGRAAIGLKFDSRSNLLYVSGGPTGAAYAYDATTGADVASIQLTTDPNTFINDVVVTKAAAYFTDSFRPVIYKVPLGKGGKLPNPAVAEEIPLSGDYQQTPGQFNANGIAASPNGKQLIIVNSFQGALYRVDSQTGEAALIDLGGGSVPAGDGILLQGKTLYVVQNSFNQVAVIQLDAGMATGMVTNTISNPLFRVPTTIARFGNVLYAVNARFDTPPTPDTEYDIVRVVVH